MKETDLAYIAGIIDGEGYIFAPCYKYGDKQHYGVTVGLEMADEIIPRWIQSCFGGKVYRREYQNTKFKPIFIWHCPRSVAEHFLHSIYPYLILKKPHAEVAFRIWASKPAWKWSTSSSRAIQEAEAILMRQLNRKGRGKK